MYQRLIAFSNPKTPPTILAKRVDIYEMKASTILPDTSTFGAFEDMIDEEAQRAWEELIDPYEAARRRREGRLEA